MTNSFAAHTTLILRCVAMLATCMFYGCAKTPPNTNTEVCDGKDNDRDGETDEGFRIGEVCGIAECQGKLACDGPFATRCKPSRQTTAELCDGSDNNCDGNVDEGCDCTTGSSRECGVSLGVCDLGTQECVDGKWSLCEGNTGPSVELCDDSDNNCDGNVDEGCDCVDGASRECGMSLGVCDFGTQECVNGKWGACEGDTEPSVELCDDIDNNCDGNVDEYFQVGIVCALAGGCPGRRVCAEDQLGTVCEPDESMFSQEICDNIDNDCDGLIDYYLSNSGLESACECLENTMLFDEHPEARKDEGAGEISEGPNCTMDTGRLTMDFNMTCPESGESPWVMCESTGTVDLSVFDSGDHGHGALEVRYTVQADVPVPGPINLYYMGANDKKKYVRLLETNGVSGTYVKYFFPIHACYQEWLGSDADTFDCSGDVEDCAGCSFAHTCGAPVGQNCEDLDFSSARLALVGEWCAMPGEFAATIQIHSIKWRSPGCM